MDTSCGPSGTSVYVSSVMGGAAAGRYTGGSQSRNCYGWTIDTAPYVYQGEVLFDYGTDNNVCTEVRPLACCDSPFVEVFSGFTTATYDGAMGGRALASFNCDAEFPAATCATWRSTTGATPRRRHPRTARGWTPASS